MVRGYRPEIDGLRAVAVTSVLLFHAGFGFASGGFVGVDVFFVISGYLITSLIVKDAEEGNFSFVAFYERRIRRLLPPIIPVFAFSWIGSFLFLTPQQFADYINSFFSALGFAANWHFLFSIGYFDGQADLKPLLHIWSLSIEEQYYLIFPAIAVVLVRRWPQALLPLAIALCGASFAYAFLLVSGGDVDLAYFNSFARFWELLVGSLIAIRPAWRPSRKAAITACEVIGAVLILVPVFAYRESTPFPGASALLPTVGTALVIVAGGRGGIVSTILSSRPFVLVGLVSYALYLWHWPILVFIRIAHPAGGTGAASFGLVVAAALSVASYHLLEKPFRARAVFATRHAAYGLLAASLAAFAIIITASGSAPLLNARSAVLAKTRHLLFEDNRGEVLAAIDEQEAYYRQVLNLNYNGKSGEFSPDKHMKWTCSFDEQNTADRVFHCLEQQASVRNVLVIGDSIGRDTTHALRLAFPNVNFIMVHQSGCPPANFPLSGRIKECFPSLAGLLERTKRSLAIDAVVLAFRYRPGNWEKVEPGLALAKELSSNVFMFGVSPVFRKGIGVFLKEVPAGEPIPRAVMKNDRAMVRWSFDAIVKRAERLALKYDVNFVNVHPFFCDRKQCSLWADDAFAKPLFWDNQHLTQFGIGRFAEFLAGEPRLRAVFTRMGARAEP